MPVNDPLLTVTDLNTGGGFSASVSGSTAGSTNTLRYQRFTGNPFDFDAWVDFGSRVGDGAFSGTVAPGHYLWHVRSVLGAESGISTVLFRPVRSTYQAIHHRIKVEAHGIISALNLPEIREVRLKKIPDKDHPYALPAVIITSFLRTEDYPGTGTNLGDDIGYPVYALFIRPEAHNDDDGHLIEYWRERVSDALRHQRLAGVSECYDCRVEPDPVIDVDDDKEEWEVSGMLFRFVVRKRRGFGV